MYIEELFDVVNSLGLENNDVIKLQNIVRVAADEYLWLKVTREKIPEKIMFDIEEWFIKQSPTLTALEISVSPMTWEEECSSYGSNPFGPSDSVTCSIDHCKTSVSFPSKLFVTEKKEAVYQKIKKRN